MIAADLDVLEAEEEGIDNVALEVVDDYDYGDLENELEALREEDERERNRVVDLPADMLDNQSLPSSRGTAGILKTSEPRQALQAGVQRERMQIDPVIDPASSSSYRNPQIGVPRQMLQPLQQGFAESDTITRVEQFTEDLGTDDFDYDTPESPRGQNNSRLTRQQQLRQQMQNRSQQRRVRIERHSDERKFLSQRPDVNQERMVRDRNNKENLDTRSRRRIVQQQQQNAFYHEQRRQRNLKSFNKGILSKEIGKQQALDDSSTFLNDDEDDEIEQSSELSSGLGYTTERPPQRRPGDSMEFQKTLAHSTDEYVQGNFTDLPVRIAYEQLHSLEAMNRKVQAVIEHNAEIFGRKVKSLDLRLMKKVFDDWRAIKVGGHQKKLLMTRLLRRYFRKQLWKAFNSWRLKHGRPHDPSFAMLKKAERVVTMGMMRRCFNGWFNVFQESVREAVLLLREQRTREETEARHNMRQLNRAERCYRKKRLYAVWVYLDKNVEHRILKRQKMRRVLLHFQNKLCARAFVSWYARFDHKREQRRKMKNAIMKIKKGATARALAGWEHAVELIQTKRRKVNKALARLKNRMLSRAFESWLYCIDLLRKQKQFALKMLMPYRYNGFHGWLDWLYMRKRNRLIVQRCLAKLKFRNLMKAWNCWTTYITTTNNDRQLNTMSGLREKLESVMRDNHQLRKDNERFVKLIDSGEWGRTRVKELAQAGEVLKGERDALQKLITNLRLEHETVKLQQQQQEAELRKTKDRILSGNFVQRNKLVVKGGSSFNGLVRAMKADMLDTNNNPSSVKDTQMDKGPSAIQMSGASGALQDPASSMLYAVDRLSMQKVSVFPDGELNVQAINPEGTEPFKRSSLKAKSARPREAVREKFVQTRSSRVGLEPSLLGMTAQEQAKLKAVMRDDERVSGMSSSAPKPL